MCGQKGSDEIYCHKNKMKGASLAEDTCYFIRLLQDDFYKQFSSFLQSMKIKTYNKPENL